MSWLPAPKALWGLVTSQESRDHVTLTLLYENLLLFIVRLGIPRIDQFCEMKKFRILRNEVSYFAKLNRN